MRRLFFLFVFCLMAHTLQAQRCAVLEFKAGVGVSQDDVDGISSIFITYFRPAGYTMVERTRIDKVIEEQGFQRSKMTEKQMVRVGEILNVSKIVVGDVNIVMRQYNVDVRVINVESGVISATEGATFTGTSYRTHMQSIAQKLAGKIAITSGGTVQASPRLTTSAPRKRTTVEVLYDYLKIFPNELGTFDSEPTSVISQINRQAKYGYNNWRIPTNEELSLLKANNYLGNGEYMTRESRRGKVLLVSDGKDYATIQAEEREQECLAEEARIKVEKERRREQLKAQGWVDLGLPSGTLWKDKNEGDTFYTYDEAIKKFGSRLPTKIQCDELEAECNWTWYGSGYQVIGPNGKKLLLPAAADLECDGRRHGRVGSYGRYWSSTPDKNNYSWGIAFNEFGKGVHIFERCHGYSVRLVQNP